jgi:hypothetical protein
MTLHGYRHDAVNIYFKALITVPGASGAPGTGCGTAAFQYAGRQWVIVKRTGEGRPAYACCGKGRELK